MMEYILTAPGKLVIWAVNPPSTNWAQALLDFGDQMGTGMSNVAKRPSLLSGLGFGALSRKYILPQILQ
jgi:hypothetical protein